jgi:uncharacterized protein
MKVVLIGATGMVGSRVLTELLSRGHEVKALVRDPAKLVGRSGLTLEAVDVTDSDALATAVAGTDAVVTAYGPGNNPELLVPATEAIIKGLKKAGVKRILMVGGAGSLEVAPGVRLIDVPNFPPEYKEIAQVHIDAKELLKASGLAWTSFSPAAVIQPGERTGKFRLGTDQLIADEKGNSSISAEDYAIALVDELERANYIGRRFTAGY